MKEINSKVASIEESIFSQMTSLANQHQAINLAQGFPNFEGPKFIRDALKESISKKAYGQYAPMPGISPLLQELQNHYRESYQLYYDDKSEITITNGATEAIMVSSLALLEPGDEVILFEPFYDSYPISAKLAGADIKVVTLREPDFKWNSQELRAAFSPKTKLVYFNNPNNPTGRVFTKEELNELLALAREFDAYILSDEVYEFLTYDNHHHIPIASLEGAKERSLTISSAGKTYGHTGLKVGWLAASPQITHACRMVHQFNVFSVNPMAQYAVTVGLQHNEKYIPQLRSTYEKKRDLLFNALKETPFTPIKPQGTYFILAKIPEAKIKEGLNDLALCKQLITQSKVATIPPSAFYSKSQEGEQYLRFCFAKDDATLEEAAKNLKSFF